MNSANIGSGDAVNSAIIGSGDAVNSAIIGSGHGNYMQFVADGEAIMCHDQLFVLFEFGDG